MAPKCRKMAPRSFQESSWPLLVALGSLLGRSWPLLAALGSLLVHLGLILEPLGAILGDLGAIKGAQEGAKWEGGRRCFAAGWPPLETFCESFFDLGI